MFNLLVYFRQSPAALLKIVEERVKPERMKLAANTSDYRKLREKWWQFARFGLEMRQTISILDRVLARSEVSEFHMLNFYSVDRAIVFSKQLVVFAFDSYYYFSLLQSSLHTLWSNRHGSTLESRSCYTPTDCFLTFPFPQTPTNINQTRAEQAGQEYYEHRQQVMTRTQLGLTKTYNRFHKPGCTDDEIVRLRELHAAMDRAILACYGWEDIDLQPDFYPNDRKKIRYMPSPSAQREIFTRLMALNQQIAAEERSQGLVVEEGDNESDESIES